MEVMCKLLIVWARFKTTFEGGKDRGKSDVKGLMIWWKHKENLTACCVSVRTMLLCIWSALLRSMTTSSCCYTTALAAFHCRLSSSLPYLIPVHRLISLFILSHWPLSHGSLDSTAICWTLSALCFSHTFFHFADTTLFPVSSHWHCQPTRHIVLDAVNIQDNENSTSFIALHTDSSFPVLWLHNI